MPNSAGSGIQADFLGAMKEFYTALLADLPNRDAMFLDRVEEATNVGWGGQGKYAVVPIHVEGGVRGQGAYQEGEQLNKYEPQDYDQMKAYIKSLAFPIELTIEARESIKKGPGAFIDAKGSEIENNMKWLREKMARMCYGDGLGTIGTVETVDVAGTPSTLTLTADTNMFWFRKGMRVDFYEPTNPPLSNRRQNAAGTDVLTTRDVGYTITAVNRVSRTITLAEDTDVGAVDAVVAGDIIVPENVGIGVAGASGNYLSGTELTGLRQLVADGNVLSTLQGLAYATYDDIKGIRDTSGVPRDISEDLLQKFYDRIDNESGNKPNFCVIGKGLRRKLLLIGYQNVRHASQKIKLGYTELSWNDMSFFVDRLMYPGKLFMGDLSTIKRAVLVPYGSLDTNPAGERQPRKTVIEWVFGTLMNLFICYPNRNGWLENLIEPA